MSGYIGIKQTKGWKATISVAMSNYIEAGSIVAGAGGLSLWVEYLHLNDIEIGLLGAVSANAFGAAIGALLGGYLCDKYGRKFIYTYDLLVYMLGMFFIICSINFPMLLTGYIITGLAVGAGVPASWTYIAEEAPHTKRAAHTGTAQLAWSLGPVAALLLSVLLAPLGLLGSRLIFAHLFVIAFITWYIRRGLVESSIWKEEKAKQEALRAIGQHSNTSLRELFSKKVNRRALLLLLGVYLFWNLTAGAMGFFMPYIYETVGGLSASTANLLQAVLWIFTVLSTYFVFMRLGDKKSRRAIYAVSAIMGIVAWVLLVYAKMTIPVLLLFVFLWGCSAGFGAQAFYGLWASELFPTKYRARAQGFMFFVARVAVGIWSIVMPTIISKLGFSVAGNMMIIFLIIAAVVGIVGAPRTQGKTLQEIERERYGSEENGELYASTSSLEETM
ncbi:MFS transporter [Saccharococcus caldoxylosilyticus]|jgi:MFS transporter, SP family, inositol transporter|uniref:MFS transporter n=1 Tax=Saccharococcus caldoxylosilyticus TaxID=81408 RepID=UPI0009BD521F|nr:MFS transporter [Parageobacillus caldoxylosilyticus]OQO97859.1 MFS transporter [Geobacillus sp. 44B]BDG35960.1 MFS transporter [Parageobacillus caldoxylosilyticus]BDG39742.1 MFS transporter [Parageobacillus caldoxylosilyticus]BDG43512.1 MFS transporter [Parageobacillus caldoxylosilyticus]